MAKGCQCFNLFKRVLTYFSKLSRIIRPWVCSCNNRWTFRVDSAWNACQNVRNFCEFYRILASPKTCAAHSVLFNNFTLDTQVSYASTDDRFGVVGSLLRAPHSTNVAEICPSSVSSTCLECVPMKIAKETLLPKMLQLFKSFLQIDVFHKLIHGCALWNSIEPTSFLKCRKNRQNHSAANGMPLSRMSCRRIQSLVLTWWVSRGSLLAKHTKKVTTNKLSILSSRHVVAPKRSGARCLASVFPVCWKKKFSRKQETV